MAKFYYIKIFTIFSIYTRVVNSFPSFAIELREGHNALKSTPVPGNNDNVDGMVLE